MSSSFTVKANIYEIDNLSGMTSAKEGLGEPLVKAHVDVGVCGHTCDIETYMVDGMVRIKLVSECPSVMKFGEALKDIGPYRAIRMPYCKNEIFKLAGITLAHVTCPLPIAVIKCVEVTARLAVPMDVKIEFRS
jgi:hypothetical protein